MQVCTKNASDFEKCNIYAKFSKQCEPWHITDTCFLSFFFLGCQFDVWRVLRSMSFRHFTSHVFFLLGNLSKIVKNPFYPFIDYRMSFVCTVMIMSLKERENSLHLSTCVYSYSQHQTPIFDPHDKQCIYNGLYTYTHYNVTLYTHSNNNHKLCTNNFKFYVGNWTNVHSFS